MSFAAPLFTNAGRTLHMRALAGETLKFTSIKLGDGQITSQAISELTDLINTIATVQINTAKRESKYFKLSGSFTNQAVTTGFYWREIGVYAADPDYPDDRTKDILYCYQNAYNLAEYIAGGGSEIIEKVIRVNMIVGNAETVTAVIDSSTVYLTQDDLNDILDGGYYTKTETDSKLEGKADTNHNHDGRYYTKTESNDLLNGKSNTNHTHDAATISAAGFMSVADKTKLDGIEEGANKYTHPLYTAQTGVPTANQSPSFGGTFQVTQPVSDTTGHITAMSSRTITIPSTAASTSSSGLVSTSAQTFAGNKTFNGQVIPAGASDVSTAQARKIYAGTNDMTAGESTLASGTIYLVYE